MESLKDRKKGTRESESLCNMHDKSDRLHRKGTYKWPIEDKKITDYIVCLQQMFN